MRTKDQLARCSLRVSCSDAVSHADSSGNHPIQQEEARDWAPHSLEVFGHIQAVFYPSGNRPLAIVTSRMAQRQGFLA